MQTPFIIPKLRSVCKRGRFFEKIINKLHSFSVLSKKSLGRDAKGKSKHNFELSRELG